MEIKKGDKFILPMVEVLDPVVQFGEVKVCWRYHTSTADISYLLLRHSRKVLGLLGDEGLEPKVGMRVWDSTFGDGEIIEVDEDIAEDIAYPVEVRRFDNGRIVLMTLDGRWAEEFNRTCYVTAMPEEPKGYAWVRNPLCSGPYTVAFITKSEAEKKFGERLIHWIPESEVKK